MRDAAPSVTMVTTFSGLTGPALLAGPLRSTGFRTRLWIASGLALTGLFILAFTCMTPALRSADGLTVALFAAFVLGLQQSIGENCGCIRFRRLAPIAFSSWGVGTGIGGIVMPFLYSVISDLPLAQRFLHMIPVLALYLAVSTALYYVSKRDATSECTTPTSAGGKEELAERLAMSFEIEAGEPPSQVYGYKVAAMFACVFGCEYFIFPTLVDRATVCPATAPLGAEGFSRCWIAYNVGLMISRASIAYFRWRRIWLLVLLQAANVAVGTVAVFWQLVPRVGTAGYALMYLWMVWVGLLGGFAYVNCIQEMNTSPKIPAAKRDMFVNLLFGCSESAIFLSCLLGYSLNQNILSFDRITTACPPVP
jgi:hypothetical protein